MFGAFWASCFVSALADMVLANTFAAWYWANSKRHVPFVVTFVGIARTVRCGDSLAGKINAPAY